jgi:hypothetical protein
MTWVVALGAIAAFGLLTWRTRRTVAGLERRLAAATGRLLAVRAGASGRRDRR